MTPADEAIELIGKFYYCGIDECDCKKCALIAVNELIECTPSINIYPPNFQSINSGVREYWIKVKYELQQLLTL